MKKVWVILQIIIFIYILIELLILHNEEAIVKLILIEFILSFPTSFIMLLTDNILINSLKVSETNIVFITFNWVIFFLFGYIQWFILLPKIYLKLGWGKKEMHSISVNKYLFVFGIIFIALYILAILML